MFYNFKDSCEHASHEVSFYTIVKAMQHTTPKKSVN